MLGDAQLLEEKIAGSGLRIKYIAQRLGISQQALHKKRRGIVPFRKLEILELQKMLNLTDEETNKIFLV